MGVTDRGFEYIFEGQFPKRAKFGRIIDTAGTEMASGPFVGMNFKSRRWILPLSASGPRPLALRL